jgi:hypothetical protein
MTGPIEPTGSRARTGAHPLLYVLVVLLLVNLAATFALYQRLTAIPRSGSDEPTLPRYLSRSALSSLAETIRNHFNSQDWTALYGEFDPVAQVQFSEDRLAEEFGRLGPLIGNIDRAEYSHYKFLGRQEAGNAFELHYVLQVSGGAFGSSGVMTISFIDRGDHPGIFSVFVNGKG